MASLSKKDAEAARLWLATLEMERHDRSYLRSPADDKPLYAPIFVPVEKPARKTTAQDKKRQEQRERMYFNAGRYSAGARDKTAISAWETLEREGEL